MKLHGWGETADRLQGLARKGDWGEMGAEINDEMLETFAVVSDPADLGNAVKGRYEGLVDRLAMYVPYVPGQRDEVWKDLIQQLRGNS
jgi:hypothetical protein